MNENAKIVGRVTHEHAHLVFNEIINENKGTKFAFVCDRLKDRDRAVAVKVSLLETFACKNKEQLKASLF